MSEEIVRKTVRPAHEGASIPDPAHPGIDISDAGTEVVWDHYWIARLARGEIEIIEARSETDDAPVAEEDNAAAAWTRGAQ